MPPLLIVLGTIFVIFLSIFYFYIKYKQTYWERLGVKGPKPIFFFGNIKDIYLIKETEADGMANIYEEFKNEKYIGLYFLWIPALLVKDEELLKNIMIKDFQYFTDHPDFLNTESKDFIFNSLFLMKGYIWKMNRQIFTKLFTTKKLKGKIINTTNVLNEILNELNETNVLNKDIDVYKYMEKLSLRAHVSNVIGVNVTQTSQEDGLTKSFHLFADPPLATILKAITYSIFPLYCKFLNFRTLPQAISKFFNQFTKDIVEMKETNYMEGDDVLSLLVNLGKENMDKKMELRDMTGHVWSFFIAGHQTTALAMSHALLLLSEHPHIQEKLRNEIDQVLQTEIEVTYESLKKMPYLKMFYDECLRYTPILGIIKRLSNTSYKLDENLTISENTPIIISVSAMHRDEKYFPAPSEFKPERFSDRSNIPYAYMPFGKGQRQCIGFRVAEILTKQMVASILSQYEVLPSDKMRSLTWDPQTLIVTNKPQNGFWIKLKQRSHPIK